MTDPIRTQIFDIPGNDKFRAEVMFEPIFSIRLRAIADPHTDLVRIDDKGQILWSAPVVTAALARTYAEAIALAAEMAENLPQWQQSFTALDMIGDLLSLVHLSERISQKSFTALDMIDDEQGDRP